MALFFNQPKNRFKLAAGLASIVVFTLALNWPAVSGLMLYKKAPSAEHSFAPIMQAYMFCKSFLHYLRLPIPFLVCVSVSAFSIFKLRRPVSVGTALVFLLSVALPMSFVIYLSIRFPYPINERYFMVFFGGGLSLLLLTVKSIADLIDNVEILKIYRKAVIILSVVCLILFFRVPAKLEVPDLIKKISKMNWNYSDDFKAYLAFDQFASDRPLLVLYDFYGVDHQPQFYFQFFLKRAERFEQGSIEFLHVFRGDERNIDYRNSVIKKIESFLKGAPDGVIALNVRGPCIQDEVMKSETGLKPINLLGYPDCAWVIEKAKSFEEVFHASVVIKKPLFLKDMLKQ